jgi:hypothetical protein
MKRLIRCCTASRQWLRSSYPAMSEAKLAANHNETVRDDQ